MASKPAGRVKAFILRVSERKVLEKERKIREKVSKSTSFVNQALW